MILNEIPEIKNIPGNYINNETDECLTKSLKMMCLIARKDSFFTRHQVKNKSFKLYVYDTNL